MKYVRGLQALLVATLVTGGCGGIVIEPDRALLPQGQPYGDQYWASVLSSHVRDGFVENRGQGGRVVHQVKRGLVDYDGLSRNREPLNRYYALLSVTGPSVTAEQFVSRAQQTAYWINAYNALVLRAVIEHYPVEAMYGLSMPQLEYDYRFRVDGRLRSPSEIQDEIMAVSGGDVRALLATSRAAIGTPPLAAEPIRAETLEGQLAAAAASALDDPNILLIDHPSRSIFVWQLILRRQNSFIEFWQNRRRVRTTYLFNVLLELASPPQRRALQNAVGYTIRPIVFDRRLNRFDPALGSAPRTDHPTGAPY